VIIHELRIGGPRLVEPERLCDERGFFARTYASAEFEAAGLEPTTVECSVSFNRDVGTLRGMHLQRSPFGETKLVRCTRGRIWDVAVDVRPDSATFGAWVSEVLDGDGGRALYIPSGFAHGFITLEPESEVFYQSSQPFHGPAGVGFRWNDPDASITWPLDPCRMSERDRNLPSLAMLRTLLGGQL
jgi:dTDP-4-dehydrorhamnose 3,5-epimerase